MGKIDSTTVRTVWVRVPHWLGDDKQAPENLELTAWGNGEGWTLAVSCGVSTDRVDLTTEALEELPRLIREALRPAAKEPF